MEWTQIIILVISMGGFFLWSRREASSQINTLRSDVTAQINEIHQEMKDFHGRLCFIEAKEAEIKKEGLKKEKRKGK